MTTVALIRSPPPPPRGRRPCPLFSPSAAESRRTDPVALAAFLADRRLMVRNVALVGLASVG